MFCFLERQQFFKNTVVSLLGGHSQDIRYKLTVIYLVGVIEHPREGVIANLNLYVYYYYVIV